MSRRTVIKSLGALALSHGLAFWPAAQAAGLRLPPPGVYRLRGEVHINGQPAQPGMPVAPGDTIITGADGEAIYIIGRDVYLQRDRSVVSIGSEALKSGLRVITGKLLAVFAKGQRQITVPTATIGIRGTACYIDARPERVYFCLCYGSADIVSARDPALTARITTRYHDSPFYLNADAVVMQAAPVIDHTDAELILLESLVGRVPPFQAAGIYSSRY